jgi:acetyltransferase-like isoleucine patch superfamily enzyme
VYVGRGTILSCKGGSIELGDHVTLGLGCVVLSESRVTIGDNCLFAAHGYLVAGGNHDMSRTDIPIIQQPSVSRGGITIEPNVWLGARVPVLDGVTIGRTRWWGRRGGDARHPPFSIAAGVPARVVRDRRRAGDEARPRRLLRAALSAVLLGTWWRADLGAIWTTVRGADAAWLLVAFALHVPGYLVSAVRWRLLLLTQRIQVRCASCSAPTWSAPSSTSPAHHGGRRRRPGVRHRQVQPVPEAAFLAVVVERLTGILGPRRLRARRPPPERGAGGRSPVTGVVIAMLGLTVVPLWLVWSPRWSAPPSGPSGGWAADASRGSSGGSSRPSRSSAARGTLLVALALGFLLQVLVVLHFYLIARALELAVPLGFFFLVVPVATFVLMLPVSINGIGVREGVFALFFAEFGVPVAGAIAFAWLGFAMVLVYGAVGGLLYALRR